VPLRIHHLITNKENAVPDIVAFQGIQGANSEIAIRQHFDDAVEIYPCSDLNELFDTLNTNKVTCGLLPVENSVAGAVSGAYELLMDSDLRIQAEIILHVHHALLVLPGMTIKDIQCVRSHPQALAQCERYLRRYHLKPISWYDTAGAARDLARDKEAGFGAIASTLAAQLYGLDILASEIEDAPFNLTRFFVLGHDTPPRGEYNKTSLIFAVRNRPAALYECLGEFASRGINLTKIESRPRRNRPWEPIFYVDFEGHWEDPICQELLIQLVQKASFLKMLGSYPAVKNDSVGI
jgi:prephenate dehydratase